MKSLEQIKNEYAVSKKFKSWENFCLVANDGMFVKAVDEIAAIYAEYCSHFIQNTQKITKSFKISELITERFG